jgi:hypothetical protein
MEQRTPSAARQAEAFARKELLGWAQTIADWAQTIAE